MAAPLIWNDLVYMPKAGGDVGVPAGSWRSM